MNAELAVLNLGIFWLQAMAVLIAGCGAAFLLRRFQPAWRLLFLQAVLIGVVSLPAIQTWRQLPMPPPPPRGVSHAITPAPAVVQPPPTRRSLSTSEWVLLIVAGGATARVVWLGLGLIRLRAYRRGAERYLDTGDATIEISAEVEGPVTFGLLRPIVLLPPSILDLDEAARQSVINHELLHVRRRDWLFAVCEQICCSVLWFVPAIWILAAQIRLAREQAVDEAVIRNGAARESYVQALVAIASQRSQPAIGAASLLIDKSHLHTRVQSIFEEVRVSSRKAVLSYAAALAAVAFTGVLITGVAPLRAQGTGFESANVRVDGATLLDTPSVQYPMPAMRTGAEGVVTCEVEIGESGGVTDARVIAGPEALRRTALSNVLRWRFNPGRKVARVHINFVKPTERAGERPVKVRVEISENVAAPVAAAIRSRMLDYEGLPFNEALMKQLYSEILAVSPSLGFRALPPNTNGELIVTIDSLGQQTSGSNPAPPPPGRIRVSGGVQHVNLIEMPAPEYPALAKQARIQGTVRFNADIAKDGTVMHLNVVSGHPLLVPAATESARRARYRPTLLNGSPVEVSTQIDINFTLSN